MKTYQKLITLYLILSCAFTSDLYPQNFIESLKRDFSEYQNKSKKERVFIVTDRDIYVNGDPVWFTAITYDMISPTVSTHSNQLSLQVLNSEYDIILEDNYDLISGRANSHFVIPADLMAGVYYLQGNTDYSPEDAFIRRKIIVNEKIVNPFISHLVYPEREYKPADLVPVALEFKDFFNNPLKSVNYTAEFYDGNKLISQFEGKTKKDGLASFEVKIPAQLNAGILSYHVAADQKGLDSEINGILYAIPSDIFIDFYPENGRLINEVHATVHAFSYNSLGKPVAVEAEIVENGKVIATLKTESNGIGSFDMLPATDGKYKYNIINPAKITKNTAFGEIAEKGIGLKVLSATPDQLKYKLVNGYENSRLVYLVGVSDGRIFWTSEHESEGEVVVDVDLANAPGTVAYFAAVNAANRIEGEQVIAIASKIKEPVQVEAVNLEASNRSKMTPAVVLKTQNRGELVISTVNSSWLLEGINNPHPSLIGLPGDICQQQIFRYYGSLDIDDDLARLLIPYYTPKEISWCKVLDTKGCFADRELEHEVERNQHFIDQFAGKYKVTKTGGNVIHSNIVCNESFVLSNPDFVKSIEYEVAEKIPPYKLLLQKGNVQIIDVLNTIKPCKMVGNGIQIFSANPGMGGPGAALIVIDGIPRGYDGTIITGMNPKSIDKISISTQATDIMKYSGFNSSAVIDVVTVKGDIKTKAAVTVDKYEQYSSADYDKDRKSGNDFRSTIYWNVCEVNDGTADYDFSFFNSDLVSDVKGVVYYFPDHGVPYCSVFEYQVK